MAARRRPRSAAIARGGDRGDGDRMSDRKQQIAQHFGAAATSFDRAAHIQARVARALADEIATHLRPARILEFGCGTGNLTAALKDRLPDARVVATDLAP